MNWEKIKNKISTIIIVSFVIIISISIFGLNFFGKATRGVVTGVSCGNRSYGVTIEYVVNGRVYKNNALATGKYKSCYHDKSCIGDSCNIEYLPFFPGLSDLIYE